MSKVRAGDATDSERTMKKVYFDDWAEKGQEQMLNDFSIDAAALKGARVLFATYTYEDYSGTALVLFKRGGKLYEVNGGHCSCFGLEGQWEPEETSKEALAKRPYLDIRVKEALKLGKIKRLFK